MSFSRVAAIGVLPAALGALGLFAACGGSVTDQTGGTTGTGTGGGKAATSSSTGAPTTSSSTGATASSSTAATTAGSGGSGGGEGAPSDTYPGPFPAPPQVIDGGGPVLAVPKIVPVFFMGDDPTMVSQIEDFVSKVGATSYWAAAVTEYGIAAATGETPVLLTEAAPATIDDSAIQTWLAGKLDGNDPLWPVADENTVYALFYPSGTTITDGSNSMSCTSFGGYHNNITLDGNHGAINVAYAVVPRCANFANFTGIDAVTTAASHELIEAATDPYPSLDPAYVQVDEDHLYWQRVLGGSEVGDMCAQFDGVFTKFAELPYTVQRTWSNKAALAGADPCVPPLPGEVYYNAAPVLNDKITLSFQGQTVTELGVKIPVGKSKGVDIDLWSGASTGGPFIVHLDDLSSLHGGAPLLSFAFAAGDPVVPCPFGDPTGAVCVSGQNGQKLHVTITVMSAGTHATQTFYVVSQLPGDVNEHLWVGMVGQ